MNADPEVSDVPPESLPEPDLARISEGVIDDSAAADAHEARLAAGGDEASSLGSAAVARARTQVGVRESPPGSNCGPPHDLYQKWIAGPGVGCVAWCAYFVGWAFDTSTLGNHDHRAPWGTSGYVPWIYEWARRQGKLVRTPEHGDIFFLNPTDGQHSHMGLVAGANAGAHQIFTCEGNWGDRVVSQLRDYSTGAYAFARV